MRFHNWLGADEKSRIILDNFNGVAFPECLFLENKYDFLFNGSSIS